MKEDHSQFIDVADLRVGHFVFIDLGWMSHPFPLNSFKIQSAEQIEAIRSLGLERIRYSPLRSERPPEPEPAAPADAGPAAETAPAAPADVPERDELAEQRASLKQVERLFSDASRSYHHIAELADVDPDAARETAVSLVDGMNRQLGAQQESCIRLLSEKLGERSSLHAINVAVVSLLLAKACELDEEGMRDVGLGALLHDIGKVRLPGRVRFQTEHLNPEDRQHYQEHVRLGVDIGRRMGLSAGALLVVGQHHECADGSGFPLRLGNGRLSQASRIVALVNRYDNLCNPSNPAQALTPYEAMSYLFAQRRHCFDERTLAVFVRMMGVYPPGSVVQLSDDRYALVVSVNATRPLKPRVLIHDPAVPRDQAVAVDLGERPELSIRRSLRPLQLPKATFDYLSPRQRYCYFFEHGRSIVEDGGPA